jgi:hypothetical protein
MRNLKAFDKITSILEESNIKPGFKRLALSLEGRGLLSEEEFTKAFREGNYRVFLDMDGVLTDWEKQYRKFGGTPYSNSGEINWKVTHGFEFWSTMDWLPGGLELWEMLAPLHPIILSSPGFSKFAKEGKTDWLRSHIGSGVQSIFDIRKEKYADSRSILVDDMEKNTSAWEHHGGLAILYKGSPAKAAKDLFHLVVKT